MVLAAGLAGNLAGWLLLGALPDEAYYWVWSQRLQAGYFDHPPLIAWMIRPFTEVFGDSPWALRLPSVTGWFVGAWFAWDLAQRLYGSRRAGWMAALIWTSLPIVQIGFHVNTPDTPMVLFAWAVFYFAVRALREDSNPFWAAAGVCAGLSMAGKYPAVLVPAAIFLGLFLSPRGRAALGRRGPWIGTAFAVVAFLPVVIWNWRHDWISFAFQLHHGVKEVASDPLPMLMKFLGGQWGAALPWTWFAMAAAALPFRSVRERLGIESFAVLSTGFWLPLVIFGAAGLTSTSHPNWPVAAYIPGAVLLAGGLERWLAQDRPWRAGIVVACYLFGVVVVNLIRFPQWLQVTGLGLPPQRTQLSQTYGWNEVKPVLKEMLDKPGCVVVADRLQSASMVALLIQDVDRVVVSNLTRFNQFHMWQQERPIPKRDLCLYFKQYDESEVVPQRVDLGEQGQWRLTRVMEHHNPDLSLRRSAFFRPDQDDHPGALGYNAAL
jgi:hypothetical protein